ncbi:MAG: acetate--CoA ligase family protein [Thermomicrobiales bacterium]|nr:acetate--CoA ligase family protein [Thermomicrobiales bacterium]
MNESKEPLRLVDVRRLNGPNAWSQTSVARFTVAAGSLGNIKERELLPPGQHGENAPQGDASVPVEQLFIALVQEIQQSAGHDVKVALCWSSGDGIFDAVVEYEDYAIATAAADIAVETLNHHFLGEDPDFDFAAAYAARIRGYMTRRTEPEGRDLVIRAARRRGVPVRIDDPPFDDIVELGTGRYLRRFWRCRASSTSLLGGRTAEQKPLTNHILRQRGIPVPNGQVVRSARRAVSAAAEIGYPVIVKPVSLTGGWGVAPNLSDAESVRDAYAAATARSGRNAVLVEAFLPGKEFRVFLVDGQLVGVIERVHSHVVGNGRSTVRQLIDEANADPRRHPEHPSRLAYTEFDEELDSMLASQDVTLDSVLPADSVIRLRMMSGPRYGGFSINRTEDIHPDNVLLARMAAEAINLDICGIDLITEDIAKSIWEHGGAILEVNSSPSFLLHINPTDGDPIDMGPAVVDLIYPEDAPFRVPVVALAAGMHSAFVAQRLSRMLEREGQTVGMVTSSQASVSGRVLTSLDRQHYHPIRAILSNPFVEYAILEVTTEDVEESGVEFESADVVVLAASDDRPTGDWRDVAEVLLSTLASDGTLVLDADDPRCPSLLTTQSAEILLVSVDRDHPVFAAHCAAGGRGIVWHADDGMDVVLLVNGDDTPAPILTFPLPCDVDDSTKRSLLLMAATAVAVGVSLEAIGEEITEAS